MTYGALVSLDTENGVLRRYQRAEGGKPKKTGQDTFTRWIVARLSEAAVFAMLQAYRVAYIPPEPPSPSPTSPKRIAKAA